MAEEAVEIVHKPKPKKKRSRTLSVVLMTLILLGSLLSVCAFLLVAEPKQPPKEYIYDVVRLPIEELSLDMRPHDRWVMRNELTDLLGTTEVRGDNAKVNDSVWIYDKSTPIGAMATDFYVYLGEAADDMGGRMRAGCTLADPIDAKTLIIDADGTLYRIEIEDGALVRRKLSHIGETHEFVDISSAGYDEMLRHIGFSKDVRVSFRGDDREFAFRLTRAQISSVAKMMRILRLRQILHKDARERSSLASARPAAR